MKIYSNKITADHVRAAFADARDAHGADIWEDIERTWMPRAYGYGTEVHGYSINGRRYVNSGGWGGAFRRAASWADWGYVIAYLFKTDPDARVGIYDNEADFIAKVRRYQPAGSSLAFLAVLLGVNEYLDLLEDTMNKRVKT
jgi:hypothetical protein